MTAHPARFDVIAPIPEILDGFRSASLIGKAIERGLIDLRVHALRDYARDKHKMIDDRPFSGGAGMLLKPEPLFEAIEAVTDPARSRRIIALSPAGETFRQSKARSYALDFVAAPMQLIFLCGRYEGIDERVIEHFKPELLSIGDYVLGGGEIAACVVIEAIARLIPGVIGNAESLADESHEEGYLEHPQYTRPAEYRGYKVPEVLMGGNHAEVAAWRKANRRIRSGA